MRHIKLTVLLISILLLNGCQIQSVLARMDTLTIFPQKRFAGGVMDFGHYLSSKLRYPLQAQQAATVGTSVVSFIVTPAGRLADVSIVNSLGKPIDSEVTRLIRSTDKLWMPADPSSSQDSIMMALQINFTLSDTRFFVESVRPDFILCDIIVVGYSSVNVFVREDAYYVNQLSSAFQEKDYKQMLKAVDELIRRNPYSDRLYLQRAKIEQELGLTKEACRDLRKITDFLGKKQLPKQFLQNCS